MKLKQKNLAVITFDDFVFNVLFIRYGGYGHHTKVQLRRDIVQGLKDVPCINDDYRWGEAEWMPLSGLYSDGFAELEYNGITTADGVARMVDDNFLYSREQTPYPTVVCLMDEFIAPCYRVVIPKEVLKQNLKDKYYNEVYELQGLTQSQAIISPLVLNERLEEACLAAYEKPYDKLDYELKRLADSKFERISILCENLADYICDLQYDDKPTLDHSKFVVNFQQLEFDFSN